MGRWIVIGLGIYWVLTGVWQPLWLWWVALGVPAWAVHIGGGLVLIVVGWVSGRPSRSRRDRRYHAPVTRWWEHLDG